MKRRFLAWVLLLSAPAATVRAQGRRLTVDDFEDGHRRAASGLSWISVSDDLMGGASFADLDVRAGATGPGRALRISGEVAADGFAGAWVALDGRARAVDLSDYTGVRLRVRGPGALRVMLRGGPMPGLNYAAPVAGQRDWAIVDVPFATLQAVKAGSPPFDPRAVRWLGVGVGAGRTGGYEFDIDDVELYAPREDARLRAQAGSTMAVAFQATTEAELPSGPWRELATDAQGDGKQKRLPDATAVAVQADEAHDRVWFRIPLAAPVPNRWLGVNIALDIDGDPGNGMGWWGTNKAFRFDRLVTVYGSATEAGYEGTMGIADAADVQAGNMLGSQGEGVRIILDRGSPAFVVGIPAAALGAANKGPVRLVAAVGSAFQHNDDVPNEGAALLAR